MLSVVCWDIVGMYTGVPAKSDSDVIFCLQLSSKTLICTPHFS